MAVKALDEVTVTDLTDIDSLVTWYALTSSTTPPTKPSTTQTSASVSSPWTTTEPSFDPAQGTRYLYTVVQTRWKDGSCTWGDVQLSSSYEQAKAAWNKANSAERTATNFIAIDTSDGSIHIANDSPSTSDTYQRQTSTETEFVVGGESMTKISGNGVRVGRLGANRVELTEDGFAQYTDGGVAGIMAGLSATNHTVDVVTQIKVLFEDVYYYKVAQNDDVYSRNTVHAEYPFLSGSSVDYPTSGVDKLLFRVERRAVVSGRSSLSTSYEVAVPFDTSYSWQMPNTSYYLQWIVGSQGKGLQLIKETADPYGASHTEMRVYCNGYATEEQLRSPVLLFGEHSDMGAPGLYAVALGRGSSSEGDNAFTAGIATNAASEAQTAIGKYNVEDANDTYALIIGNGTAADARSNAFAVGWDGTVTTARDILVIGTSDMSSIMTAASDITVDIFKFCQRSNVASILFRAKRSTATAANTAISVGTIVSGRRPPFECAGPGTLGVGDCWVDETGVVKFRSTSQIAANANFYVRVTYPIA